MFAHALWMGAASGGPSKRAKLSPPSANAAACSAKVQKNSFACLPKKKGRHKPHLHITYFCGERLASPIAARTSSFGQLKQLQSISSVPSPKRLSEFSPSGSHKAVLQGCGTVTEAHWPLKSAQETTPSPKPLERLYFLQQRHLGF